MIIRMMMRELKMHKFSDGTFQRILDKLDHMVNISLIKLYEYNKGMETRIWSEDDRRRSKDFIEVTERRLKIQRIFKSLESFVGRNTNRFYEVDKVRSKCENKGIVQNEMELELEQTQQGSSHEVSYEHVGPQDTRPQDGERPQGDDPRFDLVDDLKEAQVHISSTITSHKTKITTSKYKISLEESKTTS
ncbi:hypothetical protein Tco_0149308 [Tanacetum coccineum]